MQSLIRRLYLTIPLALAALIGCRVTDADADVMDLVRRGHYGQAVRLAEEGVREAPDDGRALDRLRNARVSYLLQQARTTLFGGDANGALDVLGSAAEVDPGNPVVAMWTRKVKGQLAEEWLDTANELSSGRDLEDASNAYEKALAFDPENRKAKLGISRVLLRMNYRQGQSKSYYNKGLETFRGYLLDQANNNFAKALEYDEKNVRADDRKKHVERLLIDERLGIAEDLERQKLYFAARNEYRLALLIDDQDPKAIAGYDRMDREVRAKRGLDEAEMDVRRGDLDKAEETLVQTGLLTEDQADEVAGVRAEIEDAGLEDLYQRALDLERDFRYPEAIATYEELLAKTDGYYADAASHKATLEDFVQRAELLYQRVLNAMTDQEALEALREIDVFWPEYRDVPERITSYVQHGNDLFRRARTAETPEEALGLLRELAAFWPEYPGLEGWMQKLEEEVGS